MSNLVVGQLQGLAANGFNISLASGSSLSIPGSVVQVKNATTGFVNQTINSATPQAVTGLSVSITPKKSTNLILIDGVLVSSWTYVSSIHIYKNGSDVISNHGGNSQSGGATALWTHYAAAFGASEDKIMPFSFQYYETANTTSATTYAIYANAGWSGAASIMYINNRNSNDMLSSSWMRVTEVAV